MDYSLSSGSRQTFSAILITAFTLLLIDIRIFCTLLYYIFALVLFSCYPVLSFESFSAPKSLSRESYHFSHRKEVQDVCTTTPVSDLMAGSMDSAPYPSI